MTATKRLLLPLCLLLSGSGMAQSLSLFEPLERSADRGDSVPAPNLPVAPPGLAEVQAAGFSLQGLARFGDEYQGTLRDAAGNTVQLSWREGERIPLPGYAGYAVLGAGAGSLQLQQPQPCFPDPAQGISCDAPNVARLAMATRPPVEQAQTAVQVQAPQPPQRAGRAQRFNGPRTAGQPVFVSQGQAVMMNENGNTVIFNAADGQPLGPEQMQALINARAQELRARLANPGGGGAVQIDSVSVQEVPAGMRVVRTPFGDRLVPDRN